MRNPLLKDIVVIGHGGSPVRSVYNSSGVIIFAKDFRYGHQHVSMFHSRVFIILDLLP